MSTIPAKKQLVLGIGKEEVEHLAMAIENIKPDRPQLHNLLLASIIATHHYVVEVHINRIVNNIFHAKIIISNDKKLILDARPSDALTIASIAKVPIYTSLAILEYAGVHEE